ncbi:MAG: hypothetical protein HPY54_10300 [Chthonomonadetes bacterium]|nr:hypothetical protein [Chthonomonadetes bacterium]
MVTDRDRTDTSAGGEGKPLFRQPVHVHLRQQEDVYALYAAPLPLYLCADVLHEYLQGRYLLLLSFSNKQMLARPNQSLAQWLRRQKLQAHSIRSSFALVPAQHVQDIARLTQTYLIFTDTPFSPDQLAQMDIEPLVTDTFSAPTWYTVLHHEIDNRLYWESREDRVSHLLCRERELLQEVLSRFLRAYLQFHQPDLPAVDDFPPLIHEQLWQYAGQGLAPGKVTSTSDGINLQVALGTPDRSVCVLAQSCPPVTQVGRGFILRWRNGGWEICSTEEFSDAP